MKKRAYEKMVKAILTNGTLIISENTIRIYHYGDMELSITSFFVTIYKNIRVQGCYRQERILGCDLRDGYIF